VLECARLAGIDVSGFHDDDPNAALDDLPNLGALDSIAQHTHAILCVGDVPIRRAAIERLEWTPSTIVHPSAIVTDDLAMGLGVLAGPRVVINPRSSIGDHAILNSGCIIEHDARIGENTHVAPGSVIAGGATIGRDTLIGVGSRILPGVTIGDACVVGGGSVVNKDLPDGAKVAGVPAQSLSP
jgi:sugar O-acyltransferase (sialic acid O-acetyltransferase NeuD family)